MIGLRPREELIDGTVIVFEPRHVALGDVGRAKPRKDAGLLASRVRRQQPGQVVQPLVETIGRLTTNTALEGSNHLENAFMVIRQCLDLGPGSAVAVVAHVIDNDPPPVLRPESEDHFPGSENCLDPAWQDAQPSQSQPSTVRSENEEDEWPYS